MVYNAGSVPERRSWTVSTPSRNLWERTKNLARRAGDEERTVSVLDLEAGVEETPAGGSETAGEEVQSDVAAGAEHDGEPDEETTSP
jgi:hypothetical protein